MDLHSLAETLRHSAGIRAKRDIAAALSSLNLDAGSVVAVGDDCAAIPDGDGYYLLFAIEGFMNRFVAEDPWFAGWCGVMVNLSDIAAMGGRPLAVVDAVWADGPDGARPVLDGLNAASRRYGVPVVGGHTNLKAAQGQLSVAVLGRARHLLTSFDARPGERLVCAIDLRGEYRKPFLNWQAAIDAPAERLRGDLAILPAIAEAGLARAAKDVSQAGIVGTAAMLAEASGVGIDIALDAIPMPDGVEISDWLQSFPSFGFLLSVAEADVAAVLSRFHARGIAAADIGAVTAISQVRLCGQGETAVVWDFAEEPLTGCAPSYVEAAQ